MAKGYEDRIKDLEAKLAAELKKMEDSNGYLKKMYEQKINNYEREIAQLKAQLSDSQKQSQTLSGKIAKLEGELEALRKEKIQMREKI